jgi:hypothetical protein
VRWVPLVLVITGLWRGSTSAATFDAARTPDDHYPNGVTVEGDIVSGDTNRLLMTLLELNRFLFAGEVPRSVYLMSKGGDVEEAMKMGMLIRRLRLGTIAPLKLPGSPPDCEVVLADKNNCVCASACFLAYAGGVERGGSFLALHRPYLEKKAASGLTDVEQETAEKKAIARIQFYLNDMEVDPFFIDKMIWNTSQDSYVVTLNDVLDHHLGADVPSIEEILLAKCDVLDSQEIRMLQSTKDMHLKDELIAKLKSGEECKHKAIEGVRRAAFEREVDDIRKGCTNELTVEFRAWERRLRAEFDFDGTIYHEIIYTWAPQWRAALSAAGFSADEIDGYLNRVRMCWLASR